MDRRAFLGMGLTGAAGAVVGSTAAIAAERVRIASSEGATGNAVVPFYGPHQAGIDTDTPAHALLVAFTLRDNTDAERLQRLLRLWTSDAALLTAGSPSMGDATPDLARTPASLTVTIGLGYGAFERAGVTARWPFEHTSIPAYAIDKLDERWTGGDLVLQICANDGLTVMHAARELMRDAQPFATPLWQQSGFHVQPDVNPGDFPRNLFGFREGVGNPVRGTADFDRCVWNAGDRQSWFAGGSAMVVRRIRMDLDLWEQVPPTMQEASLGRHLVNGAPLGGTSEFQKPDYTARTAAGALVIPEDAHMRRAESTHNILRRPFNYSDGLLETGAADSGLLFIAFASELERYLNIQSTLAAQDALNTWTTPVGSAMFVIPPGVESAEHWIGEELFSA